MFHDPTHISSKSKEIVSPSFLSRKGDEEKPIRPFSENSWPFASGVPASFSRRLLFQPMEKIGVLDTERFAWFDFVVIILIFTLPSSG